MTTLVTGGTGLLGLNVVRLLVARGERVRLLVRASKKPRLGLEGLDVEITPGDVTDADAVRNAMAGVTRVYHIAALTSQGPWQSVRRELERVNVGGTEIVAAAARAAGVERMVHTSSTVAVGHATLESPYTEESPWNGAGLGPYWDTKRAAEEVVRRAIDAGLPAVITNPGLMFGPWDIKPTSGTALLRAMQLPMGIPFYPNGGNNLCDVEDVALGHLLAMEKGRIGERYILGNENRTWKEIFTLANDVAGKPPPRIRLPRAIAVLGPFLDAIGYFAPERMDDANSATIKGGNVGLYYRSDKAIRELGLPTTPPRQSFEKAKAWFLAHGYVKGRT